MNMRSEVGEAANKSWTDDLPKCPFTAVGVSPNCSYRANAKGISHTSWDRHFYCRVDEHSCLYAVFSGHNGHSIAELAMQRIAAEILLGQLNGKNSEEDLKDVLRQSFVSAEKCYQESIDAVLTKKAILQSQLIQKGNSREMIERSLKSIYSELSVGCSVALSLIYNSKLYVSNVGTCRVLLCKSDENNAPRFVQFSVDHNFGNEDEILRLRQLGLEGQHINKFPMYSTRCLGYYVGKTGYKECDIFAQATNEPIIAAPEIVGGVPIDNSFRFLLLISSGLCKILRDIYSGDSLKENKEIVRITAKEFEFHDNLGDIAQSVVNKFVNLHQEMFQHSKNLGYEREDLTLVLRNFNIGVSTQQMRRQNQVTFNSYVEHVPPTEDNLYGTSSQYTDTTTTMSSSIDQKSKDIFDKNRKISSYVDFRPFYENVQRARMEGTLPVEIDFE